MAQNLFDQPPPDDFDSDRPLRIDDDLIDDFNLAPADQENNAPSLPIILLSAASGISFGVISLFLAYRGFGFDLQWSAAIATLGLSAGLGLTGAFLSAVTGSRAAVSNIFFSCGLILATLLFFGLCTLVGAFTATLILSLQS